MVDLKKIGAAAAILLMSAGCLSLPDGAESSVVTAAAFNQSISHSRNEQLLLNLVRLRYRDSSQFLRITSVSDSQTFTVEGSGSTNLSLMGTVLSDIGLGAGASAERQPVVSMSPLDDADFASAMLTPLSTADLALLARSGWSIERILLCCVERVGGLTNSPRASGPTPAELPDNAAFRRFAADIRALQRRDELSLIFDGEQTSLLFFGADLEIPAVLRGPDGAELVDNTVALRAVSDLERDGVPVQTRSILGVLYALSHAVEVPAGHKAAGLVTNASPVSAQTPDWDAYLNGIFRVESGAQAPSDAFVAVYYRDHWFWIEDSNLTAKTTFNLVDYLIRLKSASGGGAPLLTLGLN